MMFNLWRLVYSLCFLSIIYATQTNPEHESKYNCTIETIDNGVRDKMKLLLEDGKKVTFIHLVFVNQTNPFSDAYRGDIYRPMDWVRIAGRHGRSLLFLRPEFEELSLTTLSLETGYIDVFLIQKPDNCLLHLNTTDVEDKLRDLFLSDFKPGKNGGSLSEHEYICNVHIRNDNSNAKFFYRCCHKDPDGNTICQNLIYDYWINVVFICVIIINIVAVMFSPYLIPDSLYRKKYGRIVYEHELLSPFKMKVKKIQNIEHVKRVDDCQNAVDMENLKGTFLWQPSDTFQLNEEKRLYLNKINIKVQYRKLIPANYVPVGILETFYTMFVKCHIRKTSSFKECCSSNFCGCKDKANRAANNAKTKGRDDSTTIKEKYSWYWCLKNCMRIVMLFGTSIPWVFRIIFFYWYEKQHILERMTAASERNMTLSFQWNLTNTLTPIHMLFLLCYIVIVIDALVFGLVSHKIKEELQRLMRKCFRDMRELTRSKALTWSALVLVEPFEKFGIFGFLLFGIYLVLVLPVILGVLAFYCLPTVNIVLSLFAHFVDKLMPHAKECLSRCFRIQFKKTFHLNVLSCKKKDEQSETKRTKNRCLQLFGLIACLLTVISFILLTMEMVLFITEIFIYTIIGIIMNASAMLKYISLIFMLGLYARDCFKGISDKYLEFNKSINRLVVDSMGTKVVKIAEQGSDVQGNTAFQVNLVENEVNERDADNFKLVVKNGTPKWQIKRLILFLDNKDKPYLPVKFFKAACNMNIAGVPGSLFHNLVHATSRFLCICVFLMFVVLIVLAFGDEYQISGTNQMLATLAGGFLPWIFRNVLFKSKDSLALDTDNLIFKSNFNKTIKDYVQYYDIGLSENTHEYETNSVDETLFPATNQEDTIPKTSNSSVGDEHFDLLIYENLVKKAIVGDNL